MRDQEKTISFKELSKFYVDHYSLGYLNTNINVKFALISLIGHVVYKLKEKNPDVTYYSVVHKLAEGKGLPEELEWAIAIIAEDFSYQCTEFPTFGLEPKQIVAKIKEILGSYLPF